MADRLVERVLLARQVAGTREVRDRLVLVRGAEPVVGEQAGDLVASLAGVLLLEPVAAMPVEPFAVLTTSVRYAASWISACLKRYSGSGQRRASRTRSSRCSSRSARSDHAVAADERLEHRQPELAAEHRGGGQRVVARRGESRSIRATGSPSRPSAGSRPDRVVEAPAAVVVAHERAGVDERADELLEEERVALGRLEDPPLHLGRERSAPDQRVRAAPGRRRRTAPRAPSSRDRCGSSRAAVLLHAPGRVVALGSHA